MKKITSHTLKGVFAGVAMLVAFVLAGNLVGADFQTAEFRGETEFAVADTDGVATHETDDSPSHVLFLGFESAPIVLEVSDGLVPQVVVCDDIVTANDHGAVLVTDAAGSFVAEAAETITEITTINR